MTTRRGILGLSEWEALSPAEQRAHWRRRAASAVRAVRTMLTRPEVARRIVASPTPRTAEEQFTMFVDCDICLTQEPPVLDRVRITLLVFRHLMTSRSRRAMATWGAADTLGRSAPQDLALPLLLHALESAASPVGRGEAAHGLGVLCDRVRGKARREICDALAVRSTSDRSYDVRLTCELVHESECRRRRRGSR